MDPNYCGWLVTREIGAFDTRVAEFGRYLLNMDDAVDGPRVEIASWFDSIIEKYDGERRNQREESTKKDKRHVTFGTHR